MQFDTEATICAIATGHENGIRGAVRISGWSCLAILEKTQAIPDSIRTAMRPTRVSFGWDLHARLGSIPVDIWFWPTERSYSGSPSVELHTLGNQLILKRIIEQLCQAGARMALPGEFTLRAFLAGRMDLTQCEAVLGVIEAESQETLDIALRQLAGGLSEPLAALRRSLIDLLADLEAGLDFVDEDIQFISREQVIDRLAEASQSVELLTRQLNERQSSKHPPKVALLGLPNAGKSSLANAIAQENAAITSDLAGTTRDFVRIRCSLAHGDIDLIDTAGIDASHVSRSRLTEIDRLAQSRTYEQRDEADLILYCIDSQLDEATKLEQLNQAISMRIAPRNAPSIEDPRDAIASNVWIVWTKADAESHASLRSSTLRQVEHFPTFVTSSIELRHLERLLSSIDDWLLDRGSEISSVAPMTATRCKESLRSALESLNAAYQVADQIAGDEIVASELRIALEQLANVAGEVYTDDVLDSLFSRFCIGK